MAATKIPDSILDIPLDNVKFIKRKLMVNAGPDKIYLACFCKDANGQQLPAIKKTKQTFACHHSGSNSKLTPCGFKATHQVLNFIKDGDLLRDPFGELNTPICGTCGTSMLQLIFSSPIKDFIGLVNYSCMCPNYKDRIDIPLEDKSVSDGWYIANYFKHRETMFGDQNPKLRVMASQVKVDEPQSKKVYIPMD
jgi:hypothetical protein